AFIVPRTFQKQSIWRRLHPNFHLTSEMDIKPKSFTFLNEAYDVPCVFQVWERREKYREMGSHKTSSEDFKFVSVNEAHFAFQRVGARAGKIYSDRGDFSWRSPNSHYFIQDCTTSRRVMDILHSIEWGDVKTKTAGNPSIAKSE